MKKLLKLKRSIAKSSFSRRLPSRRSILFRSLIIAVLAGAAPIPGWAQAPTSVDGVPAPASPDFLEHHGFQIQRTVERRSE